MSMHEPPVSGEHDDSSGHPRAEQPNGPGLYEVSPDQLEACPWPARSAPGSAEADEELDASVRAHGILLPILVILRHGRLVIVAGMRRWESAKRTGREKVWIRVLDVSEAEARSITVLENTARLGLDLWEEVMAVAEYLTAKPDATVADVREYTRWSDGKACSRRLIARQLNIGVLAKARVAGEHLHRLTLADLEAVARVEDPDERARALAALCTVDESENARSVSDSGTEVVNLPSERDEVVTLAPTDRGKMTPEPSGDRCVNAVTSRIARGAGRNSLSVSPGRLRKGDIPDVIRHLLRFADALPHCPGLSDAILGWAVERGIDTTA